GRTGRLRDRGRARVARGGEQPGRVPRRARHRRRSPGGAGRRTRPAARRAADRLNTPSETDDPPHKVTGRLLSAGPSWLPALVGQSSHWVQTMDPFSVAEPSSVSLKVTHS